uniref:Uncharacterized protein n=1 Tax=Lactuca sativa TaxID=4236 RepID=A0A9R1X1U8_LACSA|nr:hypothetical protein LSAT_V11C700359460 [Lactuca sativa]
MAFFTHDQILSNLKFIHLESLCSLTSSPVYWYARLKKSLVVIDKYKEKEWDIEQLVGSGGMPSSYSATVTALGTTVGVGFQDVYALPIEHPLPDNRPLRELLGHNPPQVATGALLGFLTTTVVHLISQVATMA